MINHWIFFPINDHRHTCACPGLNIVLAVVQLKRAIALPDILVSRRTCYWKMGKSEDMRNRGNKKELFPQSKTMKFLSAQSVINLHEDHLILVWFHHRQSWCPACATPCPWTQPESLKSCWGWTSWQIRHGRHGKWLKFNTSRPDNLSKESGFSCKSSLDSGLRLADTKMSQYVTMLVSGAFWLLEMLSFMPGIRWSPLESLWDPGPSTGQAERPAWHRGATHHALYASWRKMSPYPATQSIACGAKPPSCPDPKSTCVRMAATIEVQSILTKPMSCPVWICQDQAAWRPFSL